MKFGILTLSTTRDYRKAIGLALSARISNPSVPLAVACQQEVAEILRPYFDHVIVQRKDLAGFRQKVYLDVYSPFLNTFFFDSDVLLFRDLTDITELWGRQSYTAAGQYINDGFSSFGLDRRLALSKTGKSNFVVIDGAGHAFFTAPGCKEVFELARLITDRHEEFCGKIPYADEDVMDIVMTKLNLEPAAYADFFSRYLTAVPGTLKMDATAGKCEMVARHSGEFMRPYMMHFAANEAPFPYALQLYKLFKLNKVDTTGLFMKALSEWIEMEIVRPLKRGVKRLLLSVGLSRN